MADGLRLTAYGLGQTGESIAHRSIVDPTEKKGAEMTGDKKKPNVVHANKFILDDERGKPRAVLAMYKGGPTLALLDAKGRRLRAVLRVRKDGPVLLSLNDLKGRPVWSAPE